MNAALAWPAYFGQYRFELADEGAIGRIVHAVSRIGGRRRQGAWKGGLTAGARSTAGGVVSSKAAVAGEPDRSQEMSSTQKRSRARWPRTQAPLPPPTDAAADTRSSAHHRNRANGSGPTRRDVRRCEVAGSWWAAIIVRAALSIAKKNSWPSSRRCYTPPRVARLSNQRCYPRPVGG